MSVNIIDPNIILDKINEARINLKLPYLKPCGYLMDICREHLKNLMNNDILWNDSQQELLSKKSSELMYNLQEFQIKNNIIDLPYLLFRYEEFILSPEFNLCGLVHFSLGNFEFIYLLIARSL